MKLRVFLLTVTLALFSGASARADYQYQFVSSTGQTSPTTFNVDLNGTINIQVYLVQTAPPTDPKQDLSQHGLVAGGVRLNYMNNNVQVAGITPNSLTAGQFESASTTIANSKKYARLNVINDVDGGAVMPDSNGRVLLGTFTFTGMSMGQTLVYTSDASSGVDNILANGQFLDSMINYSASQITINVVPEPGTMVLSGLLAVGIAGGAARRLRRPVVAA
ncbi:hypothetical protein GobsT_35540 [Gemmata obscuriglobus]|uniref:PEP-CTERM sorting domain-containing protein n=2 Tax=Gemmata obscuriglobus TaxID=114 RepID=A0A2Z3H3L5_9BACT|nr:PEP-CTERM sorting domain-containing protein [Gemmata obscuriglobus]AWM38317.1 hypothetical protein C1280_15870 [Gemmata obscuriglobus]QEG28768.1 hypothetical protein GobsT_35540 [Gemmata obscuriglobus]